MALSTWVSVHHAHDLALVHVPHELVREGGELFQPPALELAQHLSGWGLLSQALA